MIIYFSQVAAGLVVILIGKFNLWMNPVRIKLLRLYQHKITQLYCIVTELK